MRESGYTRENQLKPANDRASLRGQISAAGIIIGCIGCVIITASSVYTALKMGALPWPTIFTSITALVLLRALGRSSLNEANVTQIIMSAGSMVAGGLAFTVPGLWMLGMADQVSWVEMLGVALAGTLLGLVCTALIRRRFVEDSGLEYPIGTAAAETLMASRAGGKTGRKLFGSMALAGIWCALRDLAGAIPAMLCALPIPGVAFGIYNSPMLLSVGFLVGGAAVAFWLAGGLVANLGIVVGGTAAGAWDVATAQGIVQSLGMGLMMGSGLGVVLRDILPKAMAHLRSAGAGNGSAREAAPIRDRGVLALLVAAAALLICLVLGVSPVLCVAVVALAFVTTVMREAAPIRDRGVLALLVAAAALLICLVLGVSPVLCVAVVALAFVTTVMSAQSVGQTGIDPMEIFGLIVLLAIAALGESDQVKLFFIAGVFVTTVMSAQSVGQTGIDPMEIFGLIVLLAIAALGESDQVKLFFIAGVVAVACGLAGDVMSDFKTGHILGTDPRAMWVGQAIGALLGTIVSVAVMVALLKAYGPESFGPGKLFVSAQASVVATMVSGIPSTGAFLLGLAGGVVLYCLGIPSMMLGLGVYLPFYMTITAALGACVIPSTGAFLLGLAGGVVLYCLGIPSMMLGLGVYLPFYMTITAALGACVKWAYDRVATRRGTGHGAVDGEAETTHEESGIIIASGVLGGESIVGVIIALMSVAGGLLG